MIGYPAGGDGLLVSGGNMADFVCFLAARAAKARGTCAAALDAQVDQDRARGDLPFLVVGTAGSVSTGAVDPLPELAAICRARNLWFHVDGAYGGLAALASGAPESLRAISLADSVAVDPHKWLYSPLEAGCALVRRPDDLTRAFSYHPAYYHLAENDVINFVERGPQNSRGFRALKVWLGLRQVGRTGALGMIADDIRLSTHLDALVRQHDEFEALSQELSIATFRYVPPSLRGRVGSPDVERRLDDINRELLTRLEQDGDAFLSNAVVGGKFALRACIVNFRTSLDDIEALLPLIARIWREVAGEAAFSRA